MSNTTRRYPRTLQEAFGPYAHGSQLHTEYDPMPKPDRIVVIASLIAAIALVVMVAAGWIQ
jgi:hypothetical protein